MACHYRWAPVLISNRQVARGFGRLSKATGGASITRSTPELAVASWLSLELSLLATLVVRHAAIWGTDDTMANYWRNVDNGE